MKKVFFSGTSIHDGKRIVGDGIHYPKSVNYKGRVFIDGMQECANDWVEVVPSSVRTYDGIIENGVVKYLTTAAVRYKYSKYKGDESENEILVDLDYRILETFLSPYDRANKTRYEKILTRYIAAYEALNFHIASSVQIVEIKVV